MDSILEDITIQLGYSPEELPFRNQLIMDINSVFLDLHQIGIGKENGFEITGRGETWADFINGIDLPENEKTVILNSVKIYIFVKVKLLFDPPQNSYLIESLNRIADKHEWRLLTAASKSNREG